MRTYIGFMGFLGLVLGPIVGLYLPYPSSFEAIGGLIIGLLVGYLLDKVSGYNDSTKPDDK